MQAKIFPSCGWVAEPRRSSLPPHAWVTEHWPDQDGCHGELEGECGNVRKYREACATVQSVQSAHVFAYVSLLADRMIHNPRPCPELNSLPSPRLQPLLFSLFLHVAKSTWRCCSAQVVDGQGPPANFPGCRGR